MWLLLLGLIATPLVAMAQSAPESGRAIFRAACATCHGDDGRGAEPADLGFTDPPLPDFTDCSFASREPSEEWLAVVREGGPVRAFSRRMPAFGDALRPDQIERVVAYVRTLCTDDHWPPGELNFPRGLSIEKAYPEDEAILTAGVARRRGARAVDAALIYERRMGSRGQWEILVPIGSRERSNGSMTPVRVGDIGVGFKRVLHHDGQRGILTAMVEVALPTGSRSTGMGTGTAVVEPSFLLGRALGSAGFIQGQAGVEVSADRSRAGHEIFWRAATGVTLAKNFGRTISPMVEILGARELQRGVPIEWDLVPQVQVAVTRRQHVLANIGLRVPVNQRDRRPTQLLAYLLWDWFDGGFLEGW